MRTVTTITGEQNTFRAHTGEPSVNGMSGRERILAALRRQPVDRIPFVPLIDTYTLMDMDPELKQHARSLNYNEGMLLAIRALGTDIMLRHVPVTMQDRGDAPHLQALGRFSAPVEIETKLSHGIHRETLRTPVGTLTGNWGFTNNVGWIPHPIDHVVNNSKELEIFAYAVDHLSTEPRPTIHDWFIHMADEIGKEGLATTSLSNTPLMHLIESVWGLENTYYLLQDHRQEVEGILEKLHVSQRRMVEQVAESPAEVVIQYENTSSTLLSPRIFRRYCLPLLNEYAEILQSAGKLYVVHMCGKLSAFAEDLKGGRFDGIADIAPEPTGNLEMDEALARLPGKCVVGGIDATTFVNKDTEAVEARVADLIERIKPYHGALLGSGDTTPRGTPARNLHQIQRLVETAGVYR